MDKTRKQKLLRYLFPTQEIVRFMFLDLYVELIKFSQKTPLRFAKAKHSGLYFYNKLKS